MKRLFGITILLLAINYCKGQNKIGYVNFDQIFAELPETKNADSLLKNYQENLAKDYQKRQNNFNDLYAQFVKDSATLTSSVKETKRKEINASITQLQKAEEELNSKLQTEKDKLIKAIQNKILQAIKDMAKSNGFAHIIYTNNALVLNNDDDITGKIITKLTTK